MTVPNEAFFLCVCHPRAECVQHDYYTIPAANVELGLLHLKAGRLQEAETILEKTKYVTD